jgi:hypothetical protein
VDDAGPRLALQDDELDPRGPLEPDAERGAVTDAVAVRRDRHDGSQRHR